MVGRPRNKVDEHFFDTERPEKWYLLGAFFADCVCADNSLLFRSRYKDLVSIVKNQLSSKHELQSDSRGKSSYWIQITSIPYLSGVLASYGLDVPKNQRVLPGNVPVRFSGHFVRGFVDAKASLKKIKKGEGFYTVVFIHFHNLFLSGLEDVLENNAGINNGILKDRDLVLKYDDAVRLHDFIYKNFEYVKAKGIYLESKKDLFSTDLDLKNSLSQNSVDSARKVEIAKKLVLDGASASEIAERVGYSSVSSFYSCFKYHAGISFKDFKRKNLKK